MLRPFRWKRVNLLRYIPVTTVCCCYRLIYRNLRFHFDVSKYHHQAQWEGHAMKFATRFQSSLPLRVTTFQEQKRLLLTSRLCTTILDNRWSSFYPCLFIRILTRKAYLHHWCRTKSYNSLLVAYVSATKVLVLPKAAARYPWLPWHKKAMPPRC